MYYAIKIIKHRVVHTFKGAKTVTVMQRFVTFCNFALPNHQILRFLCRCQSILSAVVGSFLFQGTGMLVRL